MFFLTNSSQLINLNLHKPKLLYIGDRQYVHHTRFIEALSLDFCIKTAFIQEEPIEEDSGFSPEIVICSPLLEPLIYAVKNYQVPIIGICWAQELNEPRSVLKQNSDFSKILSSLAGIIVDNKHTESILRNTMNYQGAIARITFYLEPFRNSTLIKKGKNEPPTFISARRFEPLYRNDLILEGLRIIGREFDLHLIAVGGGTQLEEMKNRHENEIKSGLFEFTGKLTSNQTLNLIQDSDFYISASRSDGISVTLLEAMSLGKVCLVSDFPSNLEIIEDGLNGFVFENENLDSLISKCKLAIGLENSARLQISKNAIDTVSQRFDWKQSRRTLIQFLQSFTSKYS